jgi:hypothetical protein
MRSAVGLILISIGLLTCTGHFPTNTRSAHETEVTISLRSLAIDHTETFRAVHPNQLPRTVLVELREGLADAGQPFNATDDVDPGLPMRSLVVAGLSQHYCALSYWEGGIVLTFKTSIFELSDGSARLVWVSRGQGGFNLQDLKEMIESGKMHNDLPKETAKMTGAL